MIEVASAGVPAPYKDEDTRLVKQIGDGAYLLAVADGLTLSGKGRLAADTVMHLLDSIDEPSSVRVCFDRLTTWLGAETRDPSSQTTLTCGLLSVAGEPAHGLHMHFDFFAIGDSPIWKVVRHDSGAYPYLRYQIHGSPYPAGTAKVYSVVQLVKETPITGSVIFGSADIAEGEVLVVCSDGIPEREVFVSDMKGRATRKKGLCEWLFKASPYRDDGLKSVLESYEKRALLSDDATIVVARLSPLPKGEARERGAALASHVAETGASGVNEIPDGRVDQDTSQGDAQLGAAMSVVVHDVAPTVPDSSEAEPSEGPSG